MRRVYPGSYVFVQLASAETSASEYNECGMPIGLKYKSQSAFRNLSNAVNQCVSVIL